MLIYQLHRTDILNITPFPGPPYSIFCSTIREFGHKKNRRNPPEKRDASYGCYGVDPATLRPSLLNLEPDQNAAPNCSPLRVQTETAFLTKNSGLEIEKIACVDHRLGVEWKTEIRQALRNEDA